MKTSIKSLASALFLSMTLSGAVLATDDHSQQKAFKVAIFPTVDASRMWVCLEKYQSENNVSLQLINQQGEVLHQEIVMGKRSRNNTCRQQFDISQLPDGDYTFQITAGTQKESVTFRLGTPTQQVTTRLVAIR